MLSSPGDRPWTAPAVAALVAVTEEARHALSARYAVRIARFPFRAGRECRCFYRAATSPPVERRQGVAPQTNDIYLLEPSYVALPSIAREHFSIERFGQQFFVVDRGSKCGTIVAGRHIGDNRTSGRAELRDG